ncbi:MAG: heparinase II/III family protein [Armatimonadota bacterium]|nr:heparinase II/III family protein [Armatimonadota bacterium]
MTCPYQLIIGRFLLLLLCLPLALGRQAIAAETLLSDAETLDGWSKGVTLIDDAKVGPHAVRYAVPAGQAGGPTLDFSKTPADFTRGGELSFWYRFSGTGRSNLMVKIVAHPFAEGWQATWEVAPEREADGQWHRVALDLSSSYLKWGEKPDVNAKNITFRTSGSANSQLTLDLDQIVLAPALFSAQLNRVQLEGAQAQAEMTLINRTDQPLKLNINGQTVELAAGATVAHKLALALDADKWAAAKPLETLMQKITVKAEGHAATAKEFTAAVVKPLALPPHPRLLLTDQEIPKIKQRMAQHAFLQARYDKLLQDADSRLSRKTELPDRGGQWYHWYACKKDGAQLKTVSPTEHQCPVCGTVYTGWPYDDVVLSNIHNSYSDAVRNLGLAFRLSGERKYADKAREILLAYAEKYKTYPLHDINGKPNVGGGRVGPQTLDESTWTIPVCQGADLIWETLSAEDRQRIEQDLLRPAAEVIRQHKMGIHNIQCWKNSAVGLVGLLIGDATLVADAVTSDHGFRAQIAKGVSDDGQWYEGAWGYHFYTMNAVAPLAETGARCGLGLYEFEGEGKSFKKLFEGPITLAMPNFLLPAFNDSGTANLIGQHGLYELALARYGDARFAEVLRRSKRDTIEALINGVVPLPEAPARTSASQNYPASGYAILQNGQSDEASWLCLKYGPHGGGHGHPDKLNFVLYSRSHIIGVDPGTARYGVPIQNEWYKTTLAHNTLTVNETNQKPATGSSLAFLTQPGIAAGLAEAGAIYDGVRYRRAVALFGEDVILVLDMADSKQEHTYDFAYHNAGTWTPMPTGEAVAMPSKPGYQHLKDVVRVPGALPPLKLGDAKTGHELQVGLAVAARQRGEVLAGTGVGNNTTDRVPCVLMRVRGKEAVVAWMIHLGGAVPEVRVMEAGTGYTVEGRVNGKTYRFTADPDGAVKLKVE